MIFILGQKDNEAEAYIKKNFSKMTEYITSEEILFTLLEDEFISAPALSKILIANADKEMFKSVVIEDKNETATKLLKKILIRCLCWTDCPF